MSEEENSAPAATDAEKIKQLKPYLPSGREIMEMEESTFFYWIDKSRNILNERKRLRDPAYHLKMAIANIIDDPLKSETDKEERVLKLINAFYEQN